MDFSTLVKIVGNEPMFDTSLLYSGKVDPAQDRVQISRWARTGKIIQLRRGHYKIAPPYQLKPPHPFLVANSLQKASYVSLHSALSFYGHIPDLVNITTSVSTGRPERVTNPLGIFEFRHIKTELLFGYKMISFGEQSALVARPEKALLDLIYLHPTGMKPSRSKWKWIRIHPKARGWIQRC